MNNNEIREEQIVFGWQSIDEAARDVYNSLHSHLINGTPVFLYKATNLKSELIQVVVVKGMIDNGIYSVGIITNGWTAMYPKVSIEYLETTLLEDLKKWKVEGSVISMYEQLIKSERSN